MIHEMRVEGTDVVLYIFFFVILKTVVGENGEDSLLNDYPRDALSNFTGLTKSYGYTSEEHTVITKDGYILSIFRIPKGKNCQRSVIQTPVLLMPGLLMTSDSWIDAGPSAGLAFLISDACYDIWIGNVRGTYYGRKHLTLDPDTDSEFWKFSNHEMGIYDLPATIDYVLDYTGSNKLMYVGLSQGSRILLIMASEAYEYVAKIKVAINMAPAVRVKYTRSISLRLLIETYAAITPLLETPRQLEVLQKGGLIQSAVYSLCRDYVFAGTICKLFLTVIDSYDPGSVLAQTVRALFGHFPAGTSAYNLAFFGQGVISQRFQKYDYGKSENMRMYGNIQPPLYNLNHSTMPIVLIYGQNDFLVDPKDVKWLSTQLPNVKEVYEVNHPTWNHLDNCYSQYTKQRIFPKITEYLQRCSQETNF